MNSWKTAGFRKRYDSLPSEIQEQADKAYQLWKENPSRPSLRFMPKGSQWVVRINSNYRALAIKRDSAFYWHWIGPHDDYERMLKEL